jgi:hypothetical protein
VTDQNWKRRRAGSKARPTPCLPRREFDPQLDEARREEDLATLAGLPIEEGPDEVVITVRPPPVKP